MVDQDGSALFRLLAREVRKLEQQLVITEGLERKLEREGSALPDITDPSVDDLDGLARARADRPQAWIEERLEFLRFVERSLHGASTRERGYFWLGACAPFLRPVARVGPSLREEEARLENALRYYEELDRGDEQSADARLREEPWDGSAGLAPRRHMRAAWILREALDLLAEQEDDVGSLDGGS